MKKKLSSIKITGMIYLIPALIFVIGFNVVPFVWNLVLSFQKWNGFAAAEFVGIEKIENSGTKIIAIGECGLDHHWNIANPDKRNLDDFSDELFKGEEELFEMQIALAKKMNLPVIVHSRDAFEQTLSCIKNSGYNNGVIHCYSYGIEEAKEFLDLGWYIALGGGVTYTKKSKMEQ